MDSPIVDKFVHTLRGIPKLILIAIAGIFVDGSPNDDVGLDE